MSHVKFEHDAKLQSAYEVAERLVTLHDEKRESAHDIVRRIMRFGQCPLCMERLPRFDVIDGLGATEVIGASERADSDSAREPKP